MTRLAGIFVALTVLRFRKARLQTQCAAYVLPRRGHAISLELRQLKGLTCSTLNSFDS